MLNYWKWMQQHYNHMIMYSNSPTLVVIYTYYIGSCKFDYHTITTMTAPTREGGYLMRYIVNELYHYFFYGYIMIALHFSLFRCTDIVKYYLIVPLKRDHPSYQTTIQMHWYSKILLNCPPQERPPLLSLSWGERLSSIFLYQWIWIVVW
jgi:hypothetical protein